MEVLIILGNALLVAVAPATVIWLGGAHHLATVLLISLAVLSVVGLCSLAALASDAPLISVTAVVLNCGSLVLLAAMQVLSFIVSPGSGAAALPLIGAIAAINILTLNQLDDSRRETGGGLISRCGT